MRVPAAICTIFAILTLSSNMWAQSGAEQSRQPLAASSAQTPAQIVSSPEKHTVVLRNFYTDARLLFDSQGKLISSGTSGFGPTDGRIYVQKTELKRDAIVMIGVRPVLVWHAQTSDFQMTNTGRSVKVKIGLNPSSVTAEDVASVLNGVFLRHSELQQIQECPADSDKIHPIHRAVGLPVSEDADKKKLADAQNLSDLMVLCFPGGEQAYKVGQGVKAPRAIYTPDPQYTREAQAKKYQGTAVLELIVNTVGKPSTIVVVRPLGMGLEQAIAAVSSWNFSPATFQDKPVPVGINVEVNFRLY